jgi:hypothetical protein
MIKLIKITVLVSNHLLILILESIKFLSYRCLPRARKISEGPDGRQSGFFVTLKTLDMEIT